MLAHTTQVALALAQLVVPLVLSSAAVHLQIQTAHKLVGTHLILILRVTLPRCILTGTEPQTPLHDTPMLPQLTVREHRVLIIPQMVQLTVVSL